MLSHPFSFSNATQGSFSPLVPMGNNGSLLVSPFPPDSTQDHAYLYQAGRFRPCENSPFNLFLSMDDHLPFFLFGLHPKN